MGPNLSIGQFDYSDKPWLRPTMPNFDFSTQWSMPIFNFASSNTTSSTEKSETFEQRKTRLAKQREAIAEYTKIKEDGTKAVEGINAQVKEIEDGKQKDGSSKIEDKTKLKDVSFWKKAGKAGMGILTGTLNVAKSLVGFDKDGKWSLKKCLKNVAIAAGVTALCVFAAPIGAGVAAALGGGAIASAVGAAVAATPTVLAYTGLAAGVAGAGKGIYKACKAETMQELENASQEIGSGVTIAIASRAGLKKMSAAGGYTKADGGVLGLKNIFVNPWKASHTNFTTAQQVMNSAGGGMRGLGKSFKSTYTTAKNRPIDEAKNQFETQKNKYVTDLRQKIYDSYTKYNNSTGSEKQLAKAELEAMIKNYAKLTNAKTKVDWQGIKAENKRLGFFDKRKLSADEKAIYKSVRKINKHYNKTASELKSMRFKSMRKMLGNNRYAQDTHEFGMDKTSWLSGIQNQFNCIRYGIPKLTFGRAFNFGFIALDPWWAIIGPAQSLTGSPFGISNAIAQSFNPIHEFSGQHISAEQVDSTIAELNTQKEQIQKEIGKVDTKLRELSA